MNRRTLLVLVVGLLSVLAISLVAGTLTSTFDPGEEDPSEPVKDPVEGEAGDDGGESSDMGVLEGMSVPDGLFLVIGGMIVASAVGIVLLFPRSGPVMIAILALVLVAALFAPQLEFQGPEVEQNESPLNESNTTLFEEEDGDDGSSSAPSLLVAVGFVAALILALLFVLGLFWRGDDGVATTDTPEEPDTAALGEIAGRAADRIEEEASTDDDSENEVYRAWREMTGQLDIESPETTTPREFQQAAVDAGMAPDDVRELTRLFERVRYGGESVTAKRETRAVTVLRRIESTYGEQS